MEREKRRDGEFFDYINVAGQKKKFASTVINQVAGIRPGFGESKLMLTFTGGGGHCRPWRSRHPAIYFLQTSTGRGMEKPNNKSLDYRIGRIEGDIGHIKASLDEIMAKLEAMAGELGPGEEAASAGEQPMPARPPAPVEERPVAPIEGRPPVQPKVSAPKEPAPEKPVAPPPPPAFPPEPGIPPGTPPATPPLPWLRMPQYARKAQFWFTVIGVLLMLLGIVYLYNYSVEKGWITSPMKVSFGMAIGSVLLVLGIFLQKRQKFFGQMLMSAGIITFYLTGYAAFQLYDLVPFPVAMAWMGAVTLAAFVLSARQNHEILAILGAIGGLATPLLLNEGISSRNGVVAFICLVLAGSSATYLFKGWRLLLWTSVAGGWIALLYALNVSFPPFRDLSLADKAGLQTGTAFALLAFWALPLLRESLSAHNPSRWPRPRPLPGKAAFEDLTATLNRHVHALSISSPFIALAFTRAIWSLSNQVWGWVTLDLAALFGLAFLLLVITNRKSIAGSRSSTNMELRELAYTQALVALAMATMGLALILKGDARFIAITAETLALHLVAWRLRDKVILMVAHGFAAFTGAWLVLRLIENPAQGTAIFNSAALSELAFIAAAAFISWLITRREIRYAYQLAAYVMLLGWFLRELSPLTNGQGYVTISWGVCAIALLAAGILFKEVNWRLAALVTLFVVVSKLLLVDLAAVKAIWRVLLLIGFGALFLTLGYFFQSLWRPAIMPDEQNPKSDSADDSTAPIP